MTLADALRAARTQVAALELLGRRAELAHVMAYAVGLPREHGTWFCDDDGILGSCVIYSWTTGNVRVTVTTYVLDAETPPCAESSEGMAEFDVRWAWTAAGVDEAHYATTAPEEFVAFVKERFGST